MLGIGETHNLMAPSINNETKYNFEMFPTFTVDCANGFQGPASSTQLLADIPDAAATSRHPGR